MVANPDAPRGRKDTRLFFKLHNGMPEHPKVIGLSDEAFRALVTLWCWCHRNQTDGRVASAVAVRIAGATAVAELLASGMLEQVDEGYYLHDYLEHQESKAEIESSRAQKRNSGSEGGKAAARKRLEQQALQHSLQQPLQQNGSEPVADKDQDQDEERTSANADAPRADVLDLCAILSEALTHNGVKHTVGKGWHTAARLMLDTDGRDFNDVVEVIDFATTDDFWRPNILSMPKLREKYDTLRLQMQRRPQMSRSGSFFQAELARIEQQEREQRRGNVIPLQLGAGA